MKRLFDTHFWINALLSSLYAVWFLYYTWNVPDGNIIIIIYMGVPVILHVCGIIAVYTAIIKKPNKIKNAIIGVLITVVLTSLFIKAVEAYREKTIGGGHVIIRNSNLNIQ